MPYSREDAAHDAHDSELDEEALSSALVDARALVADFNDQHTEHDLQPRLAVDLTIGGDDQPLLLFSLGVSLEGDFDPAEYPSTAVDELMTDARRRVQSSEIDRWDWLVALTVLDVVEHY